MEGSDGSGKTTQFNLLKERLQAVGYDVAVFDFPRYDKESSHFVKNYLNGNYGPASKINPYTASLFYALDRYEAAKDIKQALNQGKIVLANRYTGSNMGHQGAKFDDPVEQRSFFVWADNLEYQLLNIPRPDVNYFLRVPADVSYRLIAKKNSRQYTKRIRDEHEQDKSHLRKSVETYDILCQLFPKDFKAIECAKNGKLMGVPEINNKIWERLQPLLPSQKPHASHSVVVTLGLNQSTNEPTSSGGDVLAHTFKDVSLLLGLHLKRLLPQEITDDFVFWQDNNLAFYTPGNLPREINTKYKDTIEQLGQMHKELAQKLAVYLRSRLIASGSESSLSVAELLLPVTPLSAITTLTVKLKKSDVMRVAGSLLAGESSEQQWAAQQLYLAARRKWPYEFEQPLESRNGPVSVNNIIAKLADERLSQVFSNSDDIKLLEARPRLEFDLLAEGIYPYSNLSLDEIAEEVSSWPYVQKFDSFKEAARQPDLLKKARYKLDVLSDHLTLDKMAKAARLQDVQVQSFTPRYGYDVPPVIEEGAVDDLYDACFDESLKLFSLLQGAGAENEAPYATLLGHKARWQLDINALGLLKIIDTPGLESSSTLETIIEKVSEVHPLLWEVITDKSNYSRVLPAKNGKNRVKPLHQRPVRKKSRKKGQ